MLDFIKGIIAECVKYLDSLNLDGKFSGDVIINVFFILLIPLFLYLATKIFGVTLTQLTQGFFYVRRRTYIIPKAFEAYKTQLEKDTFRLAHSWKQSNLDNILVPVNIIRAGEEDRVLIENVLIQKYKNKGNLATRMVLIGEAGSGKSVALGVIARKVWEIPQTDNIPLLPILLPFSEVKNFDNDTDFQLFEKKLSANLEARQFEHGKQSHEAENFLVNRVASRGACYIRFPARKVE